MTNPEFGWNDPEGNPPTIYDHDYHEHGEDACPYHFEGNCWMNTCEDCGDEDNPAYISHVDITPSKKERTVPVWGNPDFDPDSGMYEHLQHSDWEPYDKEKQEESAKLSKQFEEIVNPLKDEE